MSATCVARMAALTRTASRTPKSMGARRSVAPGQAAAGYVTGKDALGRTMYVPQHLEPTALLIRAVRNDQVPDSYSDDMVNNMLDLFHRTTPAAAAAIYASGRMLSKENTGEAFFSTSSGDGQADGYGTAVVHIRVPEELAELDDEFPDGEQHYRGLAPFSGQRPANAPEMVTHRPAANMSGSSRGTPRAWISSTSLRMTWRHNLGSRTVTDGSRSTQNTCL